MPSPKPSGTEPPDPRNRTPSDRAPARRIRNRLPGRAASSVWELRTRSVSETKRIGRLVGQTLRGGEVLALYGDMGTGKTALVSGIAAGLQAPPRSVSSPTFVFIHHYRGRLPLAHADLYRIESPAGIGSLGLSDFLDGRTVVAIEWADKAGGDLPEDRLELHLSHGGKTSRVFHFLARGAASAALLTRVRRRHQATPRGDAVGSGRRLTPTGRHPARSA